MIKKPITSVPNNKSKAPKKKRVPRLVVPPIDVSTLSEITLQEVTDTLSLTIKNDNYNKLITFLCMISTYTKNSQLNISFNAQSSSGKTYTVTEVAKLFPEEDKIELSGASPTAFFYGKGKKDSKREAKIVSLARKILILSEQLNSLLQIRLRPLLSHDKWELEYRMTNKNAKGSHRAEVVFLQGWPATVFCSASMQLDEQETTRAILLSPEVTEEKIKAGVHLQALRGANETGFEDELESNPERTALKNRIQAIRQANVGDIIITEEAIAAIEQRFHEMFPKLKPRNMRDIAHLVQMVKVIALLNLWFRKQPDDTIVVNQSDIDQGFELWSELAESQNMNVPPAVMDFYKDYVLSAYIEKSESPQYGLSVRNGKVGVTRNDIANYYWQINRTMLNDDWFRKQVLPQLQNGGMIEQQQPEDGDRRSFHIFPRWFPEENDPNQSNNVGKGGGVSDEEMQRLLKPFMSD